MADDLTATLAAVKGRIAVAAAADLDADALNEVYAALVQLACVDSPVLLAAVEAVLKLHRPVEYALRGGMHPGRYCAVCAGPPKWPCPEVQAITAALSGTGKEGGEGG